ncbi:hypothetical protein KY284_010433 [Solanum tuberosum]|nr:hypothetical protein KY284_010433 [Solanum tuberosum]
MMILEITNNNILNHLNRLVTEYDNELLEAIPTEDEKAQEGDHLSPVLFVIGAEALSKALSQLNHRDDFKGFSMSMNGPQVNHLCYVDDIILFSSINKKSIKLIMRELKKYQDFSGQEINKDKSCFITHQDV